MVFISRPKSSYIKVLCKGFFLHADDNDDDSEQIAFKNHFLCVISKFIL